LEIHGKTENKKIPEGRGAGLFSTTW